MKKIQTLLAHYSFLTATSLFVWSIINAPQPAGFILTLLIFPICIYFWVLVVGKMPHDSQNSEVQSTRPFPLGLLLSITLMIGAASILMYMTLIGLHTKKATPVNSASLESDLDKIKSDVSVLKNNSKTLEEIDIKLSLLQSNFLKYESGNDKSIEKELQGILEALPTATPEASITP